MTQEEKGAIAQVLQVLPKIIEIVDPWDDEMMQDLKDAKQAHANLQAFVDEAKNYEKDYGVSQYNFREFLEIVNEALRGIEG